jgi:biopolymer transport protein ExbD
MASFADILGVVREMRGLILGLSDRIGKVEVKLEGEYIAEELMEVDYAMRSLENDIEEIKINVDKADSSEIFKELAWREERSKELILFKIDESDSKSWNETKTYERTELTKTINKVCAFNESEVVFIRRVGVKTPNKVRPIVVGLKSKSRRDEIVAKGRRARIGIDENLTPKQLENKRNIKDEIKLKNEREGEGCYVYRMVGSAGNYKSIRVKKLDY